MGAGRKRSIFEGIYKDQITTKILLMYDFWKVHDFYKNLKARAASELLSIQDD